MRREDLRVGTRYRLISDIDEHRYNLTRTERYQELLAALNKGQPWRSHQTGVYLDTPDKIYRYLIESIRRFPPMPEFEAMIRAAGFERTKVEPILGGLVAIHSGWKI